MPPSQGQSTTLSLKFYVSDFFRFELCKIGLFVLFSISMSIFMISEPCLLPQLSEKIDKGEKSLEKNIKPFVKPPREVKQTVMIVGGG